MARLLRDRYFEYAPDRGWDLATGEPVKLAGVPPLLPARRPMLPALAEVLDHGVEGRPRSIAADVGMAGDIGDTIDACAREASGRGFVPVAADVYLRMRALIGEELRDRALMLIAAPGVAMASARAALVDAASHSARPHVLLILRAAGAGVAPEDGRGDACVVREAQAAYSSPPPRLPPAAVVSGDVARHLARARRAEEFVRIGRHAAAERLLRDVAGALLRRRVPGAGAETCITLGRLLLERGRAAQADAVFADAAGHAETSGDETLTQRARTWQAAARTDMARLTAAEALCRAVLVAPASVDVRSVAEATLARTLLWQGRMEDAWELDVAKAAPGDAAAPFAGAMAVRLLLARGDIFAAGQGARALVAQADANGDVLARVIALTAHLRVLTAAGDLELACACMEKIRVAAAAARCPLRLVRARLVWLDALRRAVRTQEAARVLRAVVRLRRAAPPLLRTEIEQRIRTTPATVSVTVPVTTGATAAARLPSAAVPSLALSLVAIAQREDDDRQALQALVETAARALHASRVDLWSADAGPDSVLLHAGAGLPTRLGPRVLEAGIAIGPEPGDPGHEISTPIRLGSRLLAALAARWPADRRPAADARDMLSLAAAVAAPRVDALLASGRATVRAATAIPELVGTSAAIADVRRAIVRAAAAPFSVLVEGESGVGKELVARAIHQLGPRRERRFCDVNCAALPDELLESELFGHARGAFTGAVAERAGLFEDANGGTLFLDEVFDLSPRAQAKLLRVLQQQEVRRVGETFSRKIDVRIVSAANRDLRAEAAAGRFRQDLLYRLDVVRIRIPPLRERPEDLPPLAEYFWGAAAARVGTAATLSHAAMTALARYSWPGNVRELQNVIAALAVEAPARGQVRAALLPAAISGATGVTAGRLADARAQFERRFVEVALARAAGNRTRAARELGVTRQGLLKLMARLGVAS